MYLFGKMEAVAVGVEVYGQENSQIAIAPQQLTDDQIVARWLAEKWSRTQSSNTRKSYERDVRQFKSFCPVPLGQVSEDAVLAWKVKLLERNSDRTVARKLSTIRSLFDYALQRHHVTVNPAAMVGSPKVQSWTPGKGLSEANVSALIKHGGQYGLLFEFIYYSGCRVSDAIALQWSDLEVLDNGHYEVTIQRGKGGKRRRFILAHSCSAKLLQVWEGLNDDQRKGHVFTTKKGNPVTRGRVWDALKRAGKRAGVENVHPHNLRHSFAHHANKRGVLPTDLRDQMGHSSISTTDLYLRSANVPNIGDKLIEL